MPHATSGAEAESPLVPSMLDLIRLSPRLLFPPGGVDLYRQIALLTELSEGEEVLDVACGKGVPLEYFVREYGVHGSGVDDDDRLVEVAESRSREEGIAAHLQFQTGGSDSLPYRDEIFDVTVGELGLAAHCSPVDAVRELVRVTKPGGTVVLVQLVWKAPVDEDRQRVLSAHLGARPLMLVEWKRILKEAGVVDLHTEDWSDDETSFRPRVAKPFPDFAEIFSLFEKIGILRRAWSKWGWKGVKTVLMREREVHRLLTRERILGLDLLKGTKRAGQDADVAEVEGERSAPATPGAGGIGGGAGELPAGPSGTDGGVADAETGATHDGGGGDSDASSGGETEGLPLFGGTGDR